MMREEYIGYVAKVVLELSKTHGFRPYEEFDPEIPCLSAVGGKERALEIVRDVSKRIAPDVWKEVSREFEKGFLVEKIGGAEVVYWPHLPYVPRSRYQGSGGLLLGGGRKVKLVNEGSVDEEGKERALTN